MAVTNKSGQKGVILSLLERSGVLYGNYRTLCQAKELMDEYIITMCSLLRRISQET